MAGTTTPSKYPFPSGTDFVRDGDNAIEALATAVQVGPGDVTLYRNGSWTMAVGWSKVTGWSGASYTSPNAAAQGMTPHTNGVNVPSGRYQVDAQVTFAIDGGGPRRALALGPASVASPDVSCPQCHYPAPAGSGAVQVFTLAGTVTMTAAGQIALFVYTNGIAQALDATQFRLSARRIS